jgi:hypothetical protein
MSELADDFQSKTTQDGVAGSNVIHGRPTAVQSREPGAGHLLITLNHIRSLRSVSRTTQPFCVVSSLIRILMSEH